MNRHDVLAFAAGAAILASVPLTARAQESQSGPHSSIRIHVGKDRAMQPRTDTVQIARIDTVRMPGHVDTVTNTVTQTIVRVDTIMTPMQLPHVGALYAGLAIGPSFAAPQFTNSANPGWRVEVPFGIDPEHTPFGVRVNLAYARYSPQSWLNGATPDAQMMNADADLKIRLVSGTPHNMRVQAYALGGGSYSRFENVLESGPNGWAIGSNSGAGNPGGIPVADNAWHNGFGWNVGGGVSAGKGNTSMFAELRFTRIQGVVSPIASIPLVVGVTIY